MQRRDLGDIRRRVLYAAGSPAGHAAAALDGGYELVALAPADTVSETSPGVLLVDVGADDPARFQNAGAAGDQLAVVALGPTDAVPQLPGHWYAFLPRSAHPALLARTIDNAFEHIAVRGDLSRLSRELNELNQIGVRLSAERDLASLLELILTKARAITHADAGSLYLVEEVAGDRRLRFTLAQNDSLEVPFRAFTMPLNVQSVAGYVALSGEVVNIDDAYFPPPGATYQVNRAFDRQIGYRTKSMLVVPMRTPKDEILGVLQLINCKADSGDRFASLEEIEQVAQPFGPHYADLASSLASQAAVALENSRLYENIQALFEGFVKASVTAIESRDPTTSGHSFRVAELTVGLADAVDRTTTGPYGSVRFSPDEMKEIRYASLLHDFGKVGVREEVLVKAQKLYPRHLEVIRHRAEILRRGLELRYNKRKIEYLLTKGRERFTDHETILDAELAMLIAGLDEGLERVVAANEPSVVPEDFTSAVQRYAHQAFQDHLGREHTLITPEEAQILTIPRGSLTEEERKQIESHVVHTYQFLAQIPWTREIRNVPEIARSHHEKLNGSGYPAGIKGDDIPIQSRMMTIADIFDALTAADRPYKKAISAEKALDILDYERKAGNIDGGLLDLFIDAKIFQRARPGP